MTKPNILGISGSLRRESFNTALLNSLVHDLADDINLTVQTLNDIPPFNQDDEGDPPAGVVALRDAIRAADGLLVSSPEYNHGVPGVLKNALDWASRPYGQSSYAGKPVLIMTASPGMTGGLRAHEDLYKTFLASGCHVIGGGQIGVGAAHERIQDGRITDDATMGFIKGGVANLIAAIK